ncbi:MAG: glucosidase [Terriglobales bacterium]
MTQEALRLLEASKGTASWKKWGPYLSERQWGTVREDYSEGGDAWNYFTHDQARSRAYRWGEDGIAGVSDENQILCFALALWNGKDPILKERMFGLTNSEGNHGEDVKEYYFYLDSTPTHSYMKYLYKYPQALFPYGDLIETNRRRNRNDMEYELLDTDIFNDNRYFDVFVEYAKESAEDILIRITVANRGPQKAGLAVLPTLWFRNTWSWDENSAKPLLEQKTGAGDASVIAASHPDLGVRYLYCEGTAPLLFTENETNQERVFGRPNPTPYVKDGINEYVVHGHADRVNPKKMGTKACPHYQLEVPPGESRVIRLRLTPVAPGAEKNTGVFGDRFDQVIASRLKEADEFYASITPESVSEDAAMVMRQALAGMLWSKQYYCYDVARWSREHPGRKYQGRNCEWTHLENSQVISMPDKWEYPWYAAWDLAFHNIALATVDLDFAKQQMLLILDDDYLRPNGQLPAYEWNFSDVNPPVHAWAARYIYETEKGVRGQGDLKFLKEVFQKLVVNFNWWVNRKDPGGKNIFGGGFLGLDNIGVFDRSAPLPTGGHLEQADGTAWMAFFCQCMVQLSIELAMHDPAYEPMVVTFTKQFVSIASAMEHMGDESESMWDEEDGFFYDILRLPDGTSARLKVRSLVGLLPICAATIFHGDVRKNMPDLVRKMGNFLEKHPQMATSISLESALEDGVGDTRLLDVMTEQKYRRVLSRMLDESEFLSPYGIRSISRYHLDHPYVFTAGGQEFRVQYVPAESDSGMFGGNSNWRGPVWMPINILLIRSLVNLYQYYGDDFRVECPTGSGKLMNLFEVAQELNNRLVRIFVRDEKGRRPVYGGTEKFQTDPYWKDCILFFEYFHGDNGAGVGASHQTGWTGTIARAIQVFGHLTKADVLADRAKSGFSQKTVDCAKPAA